MTTLSNAITRTELLISGDSTYSGVWARTNRGGALTCRIDAAAATSISVTSLTQGGAYYSGPVLNMHVVSSGNARRITTQPTIDGSGATTLTTVAFSTVPSTGAATLQDGFIKCPPSQRLEKNRQDRWFQVRPSSPERLDGYGAGTDRIRVGIDVLVCYQGDFLNDEMPLRAAEDYAAIGAVVTRREKQVSGVNVFRNGEADIFETDENGTYQIWRFPYEIIYYRTIREP